jgi:hypothetical protein
MITGGFIKMQNPCKTPGMKIRSKGKGRGLARGRGRGPMGVPFKDKKKARFTNPFK